MPDFKDLDSLIAYIKKDINSTLTTEVAKAVKEEIQMAVDEEVYRAGNPVAYDRRGGNEYGGMGNPLNTGSLADQNEMKAILVKDGELQVTDEADFNHSFAALSHSYGGVDLSKSLAENIEYGYDDRNMWFNEARPFMERARENIEDSDSHFESMRKGLKKRGYKVT